ncbi:TIGR03862 family flavoprotein [Pseudoroseicyclus aestuarii]|uniref:NAD(FAD)-utilizing dehydrogenase n=1 Tax=Pseudoroseicyclus aestuarii TaxID=1795041 RepID=A0A318SPN2_9RHOB|nr:TIGR03862 family flavoprotein [Pseudoroseicyclus aestuarii]PYE83663.1 hypothetical protein DFP88_10321 [Pseudoroseicyclus aestuarii]
MAQQAENAAREALVIGGGPAGLMAAEALAEQGLAVTVAEAMPTFGRKLLMAGKSGLNLTKEEDAVRFLGAYGDAPEALRAALDRFGPVQAMAWAEALGQPVFTGTSGRVFPRAMKASPLLRAWMARLRGAGVTLHTRWRWTGWDGEAVLFDTPEGALALRPAVTVLALGGASWRRLGSDGAWAARFGADAAPFKPANMGFLRPWSAHMARHFGAPLKNVVLQAGTVQARGELVISRSGLEGGAIYAVSAALREGAPLRIDLAPDLAPEALARRLEAGRRGDSTGQRLRKAGLPPAAIALLQELARPLPPEAPALASLIKALPVPLEGPRPLDEAISTAGGLRFAALDEALMLKARPGTFAAGEMLDWEAPTGGYLLTACMATGLLAGRAAADWLLRGQPDAAADRQTCFPSGPPSD